MGIYIHGLDASEKCNGCCMNLSGHCMANKGLYVGRKNLEYNSKPDWCPAMNIQPHGRLIDADALPFVKAFEEPDPLDYVRRYAVDAAPTIIPADPEGGADG